MEKENFFSGIDFNVQDYTFKPFKEPKGEEDIANDYEFKDLKGVIKREDLIKEEILIQERKLAEEKNFNITPVVKEHRGLKRQEEIEREKKILREVQKRVDLIKEDAKDEGRLEGLEIGKKEIFEKTRGDADEKLISLSDMIIDLQKGYKKILTKQKNDILNLIKDLSKWVLQRELKDDDDYIKRLLEQLISEVDSKSNLILHVSKEDFDKMPEVLEEIEGNVGKLTNVRLVMNHDSDAKGMILESDNGIIKGTQEEQFEIINKIFGNLKVDPGNE